MLRSRSRTFWKSLGSEILKTRIQESESDILPPTLQPCYIMRDDLAIDSTLSIVTIVTIQ